jgi:hypothetical protein
LISLREMRVIAISFKEKVGFSKNQLAQDARRAKTPRIAIFFKSFILEDLPELSIYIMPSTLSTRLLFSG